MIGFIRRYIENVIAAYNQPGRTFPGIAGSYRKYVRVPFVLAVIGDEQVMANIEIQKGTVVLGEGGTPAIVSHCYIEAPDLPTFRTDET